MPAAKHLPLPTAHDAAATPTDIPRRHARLRGRGRHTAGHHRRGGDARRHHITACAPTARAASPRAGGGWRWRTAPWRGDRQGGITARARRS